MRLETSTASRAAGAALLLALIASGCYTRSPGFVFAPAGMKEAKPLPHVLWVERVAIRDPALRDAELTEVAFTYNLARYLRDRHVFRSVRIRPGPVAEDDWVAVLRVERCLQRARPPLSAYLYTFFTLGAYAFLGPVTKLEFDMEAALEIRDGRGQLIGSSSSTQQSSLPAERGQATRGVTFFLDERSRLIDTLFEDVLDARAKKS